MKLNNFLKLYDISPTDVAIILSKPASEKLRRGLLEGVLDNNSLNITFASHQTDRATKTLSNRKFGMLFVPLGRGRYLLTGFYRVNGLNERDAEFFDQDECFTRLKEYSGFDIGNMCRNNDGPTSVVKLEPCETLCELVGRVIISTEKKKGEMAYMRKAETLDPPIFAFREEDWDPSPAPGWKDFIVSGPEVRGLAKSWEDELKRWSGVYMVLDRSTNERYVGSAYGEEGFFGRWKAHVKGEKGVTKYLSKCDTSNYVFSILERVPFNLPKSDIIAAEMNWMKRLHSKELGLNHGDS